LNLALQRINIGKLSLPLSTYALFLSLSPSLPLIIVTLFPLLLSFPILLQTDPLSFAYTSTVTRWPSILTQAIDGLYQASNALVYSRTDQQEKISESKIIVEKISGLKHDLGRDRPLLPITSSSNEPSTDLLNQTLATAESKGQPLTWFSSPWLFAECYLYRLLRSFFSESKYWKAYDPFAKSKLETFQSSGNAIKALAESLEMLITKAEEEKKGGASQEQILEAQKVSRQSAWESRW